MFYPRLVPGSRRFFLNVRSSRACSLASLIAFAALTSGAEWTEFRGPSGQGHSASTGLPYQWAEGSRNIVWKVPVPGQGWSSPVLSGGQIWLTSAVDRKSLHAIAFDEKTGKLLHDVEVFAIPSAPAIHEKNTYASPTPILEKDRVYVHFGTLGTAALDRSGKILWKNQQLRYQHGHGAGGSPALAGDLLVISCDGTDQQFVVALDKNTGEIRWKTARKGGAMAYTTPLVIPRGEGQQVVSPGGNHAVSYDLKTGQELWTVDYDGFSQVPRPVYAHGMVYITTGFYTPVLMAIRPDGKGNITNTPQVAWQARRGIPLTPTPLIVGDEIYIVSDNGIAACLDAKTGQEIWRQRLGNAFSASPVYAEDRVYFLSESGEATVIKAGRIFEKLAVSQLDGRTLASPAIEGKAIFLRSDTSLYRIENR